MEWGGKGLGLSDASQEGLRVSWASKSEGGQAEGD